MNWLLGMRRLSIIDVAGGHQPIASEDGQVVAVCNGEIYNFRALRSELQARGHRFATNSDSETAVHAYEEYGDAFLNKLDGMFGVAVWDRRRRRLVVARDALGIKPIYYRQDASELMFASEAKSILAVPGVQARLDSSALAQYLSVGYVCAPEFDLRWAEQARAGHGADRRERQGSQAPLSTACRLPSTTAEPKASGSKRCVPGSSAP